MNNHNDEKKLPSLPKGWIWTKLGEIFETTSGGTPSRKKLHYFGGSIPWLKSGELNNDIILTTEETITEEGLNNSSAKIIPKGTLLIALYGATAGKLGILGIDAAINQAICAIFNEYHLNLKYFYWYLSSYRNKLLNIRIGGAQPNLTQNMVKNVRIPLPPLSEQHRIVAKIEELFTRLDAGIEALKKVKAQLKRYRQAVLKYAFEGKLTEEWREKHKDELEPASLLLEKIKEERKKKLGKKYKELPPVDTEGLPELPEGWVWDRLGNICDTTSGGTPSRKIKKYFEGNIPWLKSGELNDGSIYSSEEFITEEAIKNSSAKIIPKETLLIALYGATAGKLGILKFDAAINQAICAVFPYQLMRDFLFFYLIHYRNKLLRKRVGGAQPNLTQGIVNDIPIPIFSRREQNQIVSEIERRFSIIDKMEKTVEQGLKQAERLRQSILKRAFEGKLVPQNPDDEPASVLLERIKEEKEKREREMKEKKKASSLTIDHFSRGENGDR